MKNYLSTIELQDLPEIYALGALTMPFAWSKGLYAACLQPPEYVCWQVRDEGQQLTAYLIAKKQYDFVEIINIAVHPQHQRTGLGRWLLQKLIQELCDFHEFYLEVRVSNLSAIAFYKRLGFVEIGRRRAYYPTETGREDAMVMCLKV